MVLRVTELQLTEFHLFLHVFPSGQGVKALKSLVLLLSRSMIAPRTCNNEIEATVAVVSNFSVTKVAKGFPSPISSPKIPPSVKPLRRNSCFATAAL